MPREIADGVYDLTWAEMNGLRFRVHVFDWDRPTLIDTAYEDHADSLIEAIEELGIVPERLVVTHGDPDHTGAYDAVVEEYDLEAWVPRGTDLSAANEPDVRYEDGDSVGPFEAAHVPGHSHDSHALVAPERDLLVAGDALIGADWRGLPPGYLLIPSERLSEDINEAERGLERLLEYDFEVALVSHGSSVTEGAREKLERYVNFPLPEGTKQRLGLDY